MNIRPTIQTDCEAFERSPLMTSERYYEEGMAVFRVLPECILGVTCPPDQSPTHPNELIVAVGGKHPMTLNGLLPRDTMWLCEISRYGHTIVTNNNGNGQIYAKVSIRGVEKDGTTIGRAFANARAHEEVKTLELSNNFSRDNLYLEGAGKPIKAARADLAAHAERLAWEREAAGTRPQNCTVEDYVSNLESLLSGWWSSLSVPLPERPNAHATGRPLPMKGLFTDGEKDARDGKQPHWFIPAAYWREERGVAADKATTSYQFGKLRGQFKEWVKAAPETRQDLRLLTHHRDGSEKDFPEPGVSIWLTREEVL